MMPKPLIGRKCSTRYMWGSLKRMKERTFTWVDPVSNQEKCKITTIGNWKILKMRTRLQQALTVRAWSITKIGVTKNNWRRCSSEWSTVPLDRKGNLLRSQVLGSGADQHAFMNNTTSNPEFSLSILKTFWIYTRWILKTCRCLIERKAPLLV